MRGRSRSCSTVAGEAPLARRDALARAAGVGGGECWPTAAQELLLKAALGAGEDALAAWRSWCAGVDIERLDTASHRLLPLLYRNLERLGARHPDVARYRGVYRQVWYRNQTMLAELADLLRLLHAGGVRTLVLKGAALIPLYYGDVGVRAMNDIDVLVPVARARAALDLMAGSEWTTSFPLTSSRVLLTHSVLFERGLDDFDLHWHVMEECCLPDADEAFWSGAVQVRYQNVDTLALNPGDQLLHVLVHGLRWAETPPVRWVADAMVVLARAADRVDWKRLAELAVRCGVVLPVYHGLRYLESSFAAPIPQGVLARLAGTPVPRWQVAEYRVKTLRRTSWRRLRFHWFNYKRLRHVVDTELPLGGFLGYLQGRWGVGSVWRLPGFVIAESWRRRRRTAAKT
jgi:hypothetical protein